MAELKSKKTGKVWKDAQSYFNDAVAVDPSLKSVSPDEVWAAAQSSPGYEFMDVQVTTPPPSVVQQEPAKSFNAVQMMKNLPASFGKQAKEMGTGMVEVARNINPNAMYDPKSMVSKLQQSQNPVSDFFGGISNALSAVKKDYSDFYGGGNFLKNLEADPARVAADAASLLPVVGWGAKIAGLGKTSANIGKTARVLDMASNPIALASEGVARVPKQLNKVAMNLMESSLSFPKDVKAKVRTSQTKHALQHGINMTEKGAEKATEGYGNAVDKLHGIEKDATARGVDMDVSRIQNRAMSKPPTGGTKFVNQFNDEVSDVIADPMHFGGQPIVPPSQAAKVRKNLNNSVQPEYGTVNDQTLALRKSAEKAVLEATKAELGTIPGQKAAAVRSGKWGSIAERAESVSLAMRGRSVVEHAQPGALGATIGHGMGGKFVEPVQIGALAKLLHTPPIMSGVANKIYSVNPRAVSAGARKLQSPGLQATSNVLKQAGKPNPARPFAEDDEPQVANPARPFQE